jgi:hypothetical protein
MPCIHLSIGSESAIAGNVLVSAAHAILRTFAEHSDVTSALFARNALFSPLTDYYF